MKLTIAISVSCALILMIGVALTSNSQNLEKASETKSSTESIVIREGFLSTLIPEAALSQLKVETPHVSRIAVASQSELDELRVLLAATELELTEAKKTVADLTFRLQRQKIELAALHEAEFESLQSQLFGHPLAKQISAQELSSVLYGLSYIHDGEIPNYEMELFITAARKYMPPISRLLDDWSEANKKYQDSNHEEVQAANEALEKAERLWLHELRMILGQQRLRYPADE